MQGVFNVSEGRSHREIKDYAAKLLKDKYGCERIEFEYPLTDRSGQVFKVDVVGFKAQDRFAVECGDTNQIKLNKLDALFKEVIHLSYEDFVNILLNEIELLRKERLDQTPVYIDKREVKYYEFNPLKQYISLLDSNRKVLLKVSFNWPTISPHRRKRE